MELKEVSYIVTDEPLDKEWEEICAKNKIKIIVAE